MNRVQYFSVDLTMNADLNRPVWLGYRDKS